MTQNVQIKLHHDLVILADNYEVKQICYKMEPEQDNVFALIAWMNENPIGYLKIHRSTTKTFDWFCSGFGINCNHRRTGIGRKMLGFLSEYLIHLQLPRLYLWPEKGSEKFYLANGFVRSYDGYFGINFSQGYIYDRRTEKTTNRYWNFKFKGLARN